jgi:secreted trypsin-like serine protease
LLARSLCHKEPKTHRIPPLKWLKPLEVAQNQQEKTKYTSNPISDAQDIKPNIIGGTAAILEQIPHQVFVDVDSSSFCGGALINFFWALTAGHWGHCVYG